MKRWIKIILISVVSLAGLAVTASILLLGGISMEIEGKWPFKPLDRWRTEIPVSTAGTIILEAVEQRGFDSDGFNIGASYRPPQSPSSEPFGSWVGYKQEPKAYAAGSLLVVLSPDQHTIYVRTGERRWSHFLMLFPVEAPSQRLWFYSQATGLSEADLQQIRSDIAEDERHWSPSAYVRGFDPQTRILTVLYLTNPTTQRYLSLRLSEDGTTLHLADVREVEAVSALPTSP